MNEDNESNNRPSIEEVFGGKDVSLGKEIVENLQAEEIGLPVYRYYHKEKKTEYLVDRKKGEDDVSVREKTETPRTKIGVILPTSNENEYVFLGIQEQGFIFTVSNEHTRRELDYTREPSLSTFASMERFSELLNFWESFDYAKISATEDTNTEDYNRTMVSAVETQREIVRKRKANRSESRSNLFNALYKSGEEK